MTESLDIDYTQWDWLPQAAVEVEQYIRQVLANVSLGAHSVSARAKSIGSFQTKCREKGYRNPLADVTDSVAVRIITYSLIDQDRAAQLIRDHFEVKVGEDKNPGEGREERRRGYNSRHLVITAERSDVETSWMITGGSLARYFREFGGLEVQVRTVASHAWAEFEHARRYKGEQYKSVGEKDQEILDQLFGAASDARRALDETFVAIEKILANPTSAQGVEGVALAGSSSTADGEDAAVDSLDPAALSAFLTERYPEDKSATEVGYEFAAKLVHACRIPSLEELQDLLGEIDGDVVRRLMSTDIPVTNVRRLDDELLAVYGDSYIDWTASIGRVEARRRQLEWRYDRIRGKIPDAAYNQYSFDGASCSSDILGRRFPAARTLRELVRLLAERDESIDLESDYVSRTGDISPGLRPVEVSLKDGGSVRVAANLKRAASESEIRRLLGKADGLDIRVLRGDQVIASVEGGQERAKY